MIDCSWMVTTQAEHGPKLNVLMTDCVNQLDTTIAYGGSILLLNLVKMYTLEQKTDGSLNQLKRFENSGKETHYNFKKSGCKWNMS